MTNTFGFYTGKIKDGALRDQFGRLVPGGLVRKYNLYGDGAAYSKGWKSYLARELSKVSGGLDGLTKTEHGYTNQEGLL